MTTTNAKFDAQEILKELKPLGKDTYKKTLMNHGIKEPIYGVKIEDMKKIVKRVKKDYQLAIDLFDTGVYDARYLAGLVADDAKMTKKDLQRWVKNADNKSLSEYTVPWVAAESQHGLELALEWIDSKKESIASSGWSTLGSLVAIKEDKDLDLALLKKLLARVEKTIHDAPDRARYAMNGFVIAVGCYVKPLTTLALETGKRMGSVEIDMGDTACKVPSVSEYIQKVKARGTLGKKRKTTKC